MSRARVLADPLDVLDIRAAAAFLGTHAQTIRKLARRGAIPAFKVGRDWRFRKQAIVTWSEQQARGPACSILIVDDDERVGAALAAMVTEFGCRARHALSGAVGLRLVAEAVPDVVLLDLRMPDMTGPQFLARLRQTHPALPVVVVTGHPDCDLVSDAARHAPVMLLAKPVERALLERTVRMVVGDKLRGRT